ncbi:ornithine cyclodeaminase [Polymorphospora sp. NPDC050346]|uniref:ornithine cyclodeaminase n=1 Tax=Polymorphospora sp. NPDC050346 TaxID=3155780 RepID=UPI0033C16C4B
MLDLPGYPDAELLYLSRAHVIECLDGVDPVAVTAEALRLHTLGDTILPDEAYLPWQTKAGHSARSLGMPGAIRTDDGLVLGMKVINASLGNPANGLARSQGLLMMLDAETAYPWAVMESAYISALRTAAVTAVAAQRLGPDPIGRLAVLGCGTLAQVHLRLLPSVLEKLAEISVFDLDPARSAGLADALRADPDTGHLAVTSAGTARECVEGADLVLAVTVTTEGYIAYDWLKPGALIAHVSLDDVLPEVVTRADLVFVDDWGLVSHDDRRLLGRMWRAGTLRDADGAYRPGATPDPDAARVHGSLGDVIAGRHPGRSAPTDIVLSNPFGMSILDVALGAVVAETARERGLGLRIPR